MVSNYMIMSFTLSGALLLIGGLLILRGYRLRVRGDTPHCRTCDYNLTLLESPRCPECGTELEPASIVHGERYRRPNLAVAGILCVAMGAFISSPPVRRINWYQQAPAAWVLRDLRSAAPASRAKAWTELMRREKAGALSTRNRSILLDQCLNEQSFTLTANPRTEMIDYLGSCYAGGLLSSQQKARFLDQIVELKLAVRPAAVRPELVPVRILMQGRSPCTGGLKVEVSGATVILDGQAMGRGMCIGSATSCGIGGGEIGISIPCDSPGKHELTVIARVRIVGPRVPPEDEHAYRGNGQVALHGRFEVLAAAPMDSVRLVDDPSLKTSLLTCVIPTQFTYGKNAPGELMGCIEVRNPPINLAFDVWVRTGEWERKLGRVSYRKAAPGKQQTMSGLYVQAKLDSPPPAKCDVILRRSEQAARQTVDLFEIWKGELVFEDVSVEVFDPTTKATIR